MPDSTDSKQRVLVDAIELDSIFRFHRILRSITAALQPARMTIALLMVTALMTAGRVWDRAAEPGVSPHGLVAGPASPEERDLADRMIANTMGGYAGGLPAEMTGPVHLRVRELQPLLRGAYERHRSAAGADAAAEATRYLQAVRSIDAVRPRGTFEATVEHVAQRFGNLVHGVLYLDADEVFNDGLRGLILELPPALWKDHRGFTIVYGLVFLLVMAVGGGALSRMAACQWASGERISIREGVDHALRSWWKSVSALVLPLLLAGVAAVVILIIGLLMRLPWLIDVLGAIAYGPALLLGALVAFMVIGYVFGLPLLIPAVACENCDGPDAQQRAYAYVLNRPLHLLGYGLVATVGLALGFAIVGLFVAATLNVTAVVFAAGGGDHPAPAPLGGFALFDLEQADAAAVATTAGERWSSGILTFWQTVVLCLVPAYVLAYYFTAATKVYLLLRLSCDGQDVEEIWQPGLEPGTYTPTPESLEASDGDDGSS